MALVLVVAVLGLALGLLLGGRLEALADQHVRLAAALPVGLAVQVVALLLEPAGRALAAFGYAVAAGLVGAFALANLRLPGVPLMGLGLLLNALVVLANGVAMPVSVAAAQRAGLSRADLRLDDDPLHVERTDRTRLGWLGDVVAVPLPLRPQIVSAGDVLLASGVGLFLCLGTRPRRGVGGGAGGGAGAGAGDRAAGPDAERAGAQPPSRELRSSTLASDSTTPGSYS